MSIKQQPKLKLQIDTNLKTIKVEGLTSLKELFDGLEKLLPKDSPFGSWKEFQLDTTTQIVYWTNPLYVPYTNPYPWWEQPKTIYNTNYSLGNPATSNFNTLTEPYESMAMDKEMWGDKSQNNVYNIELTQ